MSLFAGVTSPVEDIDIEEVACAIPASLPTTKYPWVTGKVREDADPPITEIGCESERRPEAVSVVVATFANVLAPEK